MEEELQDPFGLFTEELFGEGPAGRLYMLKISFPDPL